jgi:hypothetical protein
MRTCRSTVVGARNLQVTKHVRLWRRCEAGKLGHGGCDSIHFELERGRHTRRQKLLLAYLPCERRMIMMQHGANRSPLVFATLSGSSTISLSLTSNNTRNTVELAKQKMYVLDNVS